MTEKGGHLLHETPLFFRHGSKAERLPKLCGRTDQADRMQGFKALAFLAAGSVRSLSFEPAFTTHALRSLFEI